MPGRADRADSDAIGRSLGISWFEKIEDAGSTYVRRVAREGEHLELSLRTLAEILRSAGHTPAVSVHETARDVELALEASFLHHSLVRLDSVRETSADDPFVFSLSNPLDAERLFWDETPLDAMTKMGLARRLEMEQGQNRLRVFNDMTKTGLLLLLDPGHAIPVPAAGKGKGRGGGKGRPGRGRV